MNKLNPVRLETAKNKVVVLLQSKTNHPIRDPGDQKKEELKILLLSLSL